METCDTCKHWDWERNIAMAECRKVNTWPGHGFSDHPKAFYASDNQRTRGGTLFTCAKFGCIHHEPK